MAKQRIYADRPLTNAECKRRFDDRAASIDKDVDDAF